MSRYIDADALKKQKEYCADRHEYIVPVAKIDWLPIADVVPVVHGKWKDEPNPQWKAYNIRYCSECEWSIHKTHLRNKDLNWNFCPNCGAKMDSGT